MDDKQRVLDSLNRENDVQVRVDTIRDIKAGIATTLGPERLREELIPILIDNVDDEDQALLALAEELPGLLSAVGGPEHAVAILIPLERLASAEELAIRTKAVQSLLDVSSKMSSNMPVVELALRLVDGDWFSRMSSSILLAKLYGSVDDDTKANLTSTYTTLCNDATPMVRRSACDHLKLVIASANISIVTDKLLPIFSSLVVDEQDSVRIMAVGCCGALAKRLSKEQNIKLIMPAIKQCADDKSWRVRYALADDFINLANALGGVLMAEHLKPAFIQLLSDKEPEIRTAAAREVAGIAKMIGNEQAVENILPCLPSLATDASQEVRMALASNLMALAPVFGMKKTKEHLLPLIFKLLADTDPKVRLGIISKAEEVKDLIGDQELSEHLLAAISELAHHQLWRVRLSVIESIPLLAEQLGVEFFDAKLGVLCFGWLSDSVFSIRTAAIENLQKITRIFGAVWCQGNVVPRLVELSKHSNYLYRTTCLFAITALAKDVGDDVTVTSLLPIVLTMAEDRVPNIRFNVCKTLIELKPVLAGAGSDKWTTVPPVLDRLVEDPDRDVRHFASVLVA
mmetsp:Transcript_11642/g.12790  ORF Transcript_11642/g.12790 Transcript_11642/m.12790 type:complete len:572 (-) Transcript_11642:137-1852(-)|eukprot:CAMPEP_0168529876 /NCGR_PEP_ID=MMETSP0405-20121227/14228_1 /TAXON_ID=498012 /ORGANISM="Trichosphaerium sp, Strain Am-I-7 wt" /LENGTH=571 /DNA_ID=CAMNT_0008553801 /DNA_START=21 /DNA_END=1736 /DNA_ORIENTATION=+